MSSTTAVPTREPGVLGLAFRDPEVFLLRWHREGQPYPTSTFAGLAGIAVGGTFAYGALLGVGDGWERVLSCALLNTAAAAIAWVVPLPAVYILNSLTGLRLRASTTFLAALVTAAWGGFAFLAFLPIALVYLLAFPGHNGVALFAHLLVFSLVGFIPNAA